MTRNQRKQRRRRALAIVLMLLFVAAVCAVRCFAFDGVVDTADGFTRFLVILGAASLTDCTMRVVFWLDGAK